MNYIKDLRIALVTIIWVILVLTLFYYLSIARIEKLVAHNAADYLIINILAAIRPVIAGIDENTRKSIKFEIKPTPEPVEPAKEENIFKGSYGTMRIIMLVTGILLAINLIYNILIFSKAGLVLFIIAMLTAIIITLIEFIFAEIITPSFIFVDFNKTMHNLVKTLHAKFNCASEIATDTKCKSACPNTFTKCNLSQDILRYCKDFEGVDICPNQPNGLKDGKCTNDKTKCVITQ